MTEEKNNHRMLIARVIVAHGDKVLFVHRSQGSSRPGVWEVPGGRVDPGESFEEAAIREIKEEAGLDIPELIFDHSSSYEFDGQNRIATVFRAEVKDTTVTLSDEHDDFTWADASNFNNLNLEKPYQDYFDKYFPTDKHKHNGSQVLEKSTTKDSEITKLIAYTDGGSRGNPGPSASGYVVMDEDENILSEGGEYLGITTNNQAEYQAVRTALEVCIELGARRVDFYIDSQLVVKQMNGEYKIKNRDLWPIHENIKELASGLEQVTFTHVYREDNKLADAKVNEVLDNRSNPAGH